jgi:hypothetical protein
MVVSSTCMKVASDRPIVLSARLGGRKEAVMGVSRRLGLTCRHPCWRE